MKNVACTLVLVLLTSICFSTTTLAAEKQSYTKPQELVDRSVSVVKSFGADKDLVTFRSLMAKAKGIFIVPQILKGGFIIGGSGGSGVLLAKDPKTGAWSYPAFYTIGSVTFGLQIGAESSRAILLVMTQKGMESMLFTSFKLGAEASVATGPVGAGAKAATADILAYMQTSGAFTGATVEGAVITTRDKWNNSYYGRAISPGDVLYRKAVTNPEADLLRQTVTDLVNRQQQ